MHPQRRQPWKRFFVAIADAISKEFYLGLWLVTDFPVGKGATRCPA